MFIRLLKIYWKRLFIWLLILFAIYLLFNNKLGKSQLKIFGHHSTVEWCQFPNINPWDPTILAYVEKPSTVLCSQSQPFLTFVDYSGVLHFNRTEVESLKKNNFTDINCTYQTFDRDDTSSDVNAIKYDPKVWFNKAVVLEKGSVIVECSAKKKGGTNVSQLYFNIHANRARWSGKYFSKPTDNQLSVLIVAIDGLSYSLFRRSMPQTNEYVTKTMGMIMMEKFNKIGDNTLPNIIAAMTGKRLYDEDRDITKPLEFLERFLLTKSNYLPFVWKYFSHKGYATIFNEDRPDIPLYGFQASNAFEMRKMIDYYYPIFWTAVQKDFTDRGLNVFNSYCFRNYPNDQLFVDILKRHVTSMNDYLQFVYSLFNYYTHDFQGGIMIENADFSYKEFFREMFQKGHLNKTAIIFMSDHGQRSGEVRKTYVGLLEERNPILGIWFPEWFYRLHPRIKRNLLINSKRLSSTFDVHETLLDILNANYNQSYQAIGHKYGLSLLSELGSNRTCSDAGIPSQYCLCFKQKSLDAKSNDLVPLVAVLLDALNTLVKRDKQCLEIKVEEIIRAEQLKFHDNIDVTYRKLNSKTKLDVDSEIVDRIRLTVKTQPNTAIFEAVVIKSNNESNWRVEGEIERISYYKNSSACVKNKILRKYCTCK